MRYRREIDGLRAIAVLPVMLFHAGFTAFSGGYVGVDVFFVISGYLITTILINDLERGRFSILRFYERRARRILPALFLVMTACLPFAWLWLPPVQLKLFAKSLFAVVFFSSNVLFWREDDYFAPAAEEKPLLHTWSLGVEEQYYLLFPLFLFFFWRFGRHRVFWIIAALAGASLLLSEWGWRNAPVANFYLAPTRAWELLAGSICAFLSTGDRQRSNEVLSAAGLALILYAIFAFDSSTPFPGVYALAPVLGTALVIMFGHPQTMTARLLSLSPFVGIGLISYSAYLWHQPLFAFARVRSLTEPSQALMAGLGLLALALAWISWRYIEQPFRNRKSPFPATRSRLFASSAAVGGIFAVLGLAGYFGQGFGWRLDPVQQDIIARSQPVSYDCDAFEDCLLGDKDGEFSGIAFVGDSHMGRYAYLLNEVFAGQGRSARLVSKGWCAPLLYWRPAVIDRCGGTGAEDFEREFLEVLHDDRIHTIVLAAEWANYTTGYRYGTSAIAYDFMQGSERNVEPSRNGEEFARAFEATIDELGAKRIGIIIVGPVPEYNFDVPRVALKFSMLSTGVNDEFRQTADAYATRSAGFFAALAKDSNSFVFIDVWPLICDEYFCSPFSSEGYPLYNDGNHMVRDGMVKIVEEILNQIQSRERSSHL